MQHFRDIAVWSMLTGLTATGMKHFLELVCFMGLGHVTSFVLRKS